MKYSIFFLCIIILCAKVTFNQVLETGAKRGVVNKTKLIYLVGNETDSIYHFEKTYYVVKKNVNNNIEFEVIEKTTKDTLYSRLLTKNSDTSIVISTFIRESNKVCKEIKTLCKYNISVEGFFNDITYISVLQMINYNSYLPEYCTNDFPTPILISINKQKLFNYESVVYNKIWESDSVFSIDNGKKELIDYQFFNFEKGVLIAGLGYYHNSFRNIMHKVTPFLTSHLSFNGDTAYYNIYNELSKEKIYYKYFKNVIVSQTVTYPQEYPYEFNIETIEYKYPSSNICEAIINHQTYITEIIIEKNTQMQLKK